MAEAVTYSQFSDIVDQQLTLHGVHSYEFVDSGVGHFVALIPEASIVIKVPRDGNPQTLITQHHMIRCLADIDLPFRHASFSELHLPTPSEPHAFQVIEYIPGAVIVGKDLSEAQRYTYGQDVASYALALRTRLSKSVYEERITLPAMRDGVPRGVAGANLGEEERSGGILWPLATQEGLTRYPELADLLSWCHNVRKLHYPGSLEEHRTDIANSDVRLANSIFDSQCRLAGIIDPDIFRTNLAFYTRGLYLLGASALQGFNDILDDHGHTPVAIELAKFHALVLQTTAIARLILRQPQSIYLPRHISLLKEATPERDWSELNNLL